jgi:hypothetical protein
LLIFLLLPAGRPQPTAGAEATLGGTPFHAVRYDMEITGIIETAADGNMMTINGTYHNRYWEPVVNVTLYWQVLRAAPAECIGVS